MEVAADVSQLAAALARARAALTGAHYDQALALLDGCEDWPVELAERAIVVKAETVGRRDLTAAVEYLSAVQDLPASDAGRFHHALQCSKALGTVRDFAAAQSALDRARRFANAVPEAAHSLAFYTIRLRLFRSENTPDAPEVGLAIAHPDPTMVSSAYSARAWMHAARGEYTQHVRDLRLAVEVAETAPASQIDVSVIGNSVFALAQFGFETADEDAVAAARRVFERLAWTGDVRSPHFLATRALGWDAFMRGRPGHAQWAFRDAAELAPSQPWRIMAHLDRAYVARMSGNAVWALEELMKADQLAQDVRWEACFDEGRQVLVTLASLFAPVNAARARRYAALYTSIGTENLDPRLAVQRPDARARAFTLYAAGRIEFALGRREQAVALQREAYELFAGASYHYRAAMAATALAELTGERSWQARAHAHVRRYPDCPLAVVVDEAVERERALPAELSAFQRQLAQALWAGAEPAELSRRFSRSMYTIEQQLGRIYAAFGVATRSAFVSRGRELGFA